MTWSPGGPDPYQRDQDPNEPQSGQRPEPSQPGQPQPGQPQPPGGSEYGQPGMTPPGEQPGQPGMPPPAEQPGQPGMPPPAEQPGQPGMPPSMEQPGQPGATGYGQMPGYGQQGPYQGYPQEPATGPGYGYPPRPARQTNIMAILSLIFAFVFAPLGVVFGYIARNQIRQTGEAGEGIAKAGLILGWIFTVLWLIGCAFWIIVAVIAGNDSGTTY